MKTRRVRLTVRELYGTTKSVRVTSRPLSRILRLAWLEYPFARSIEVEILPPLEVLK